MKQETKPQKYLRLYRWLRRQGYAVRTARASARMQAGYPLLPDKGYWVRFWKFSGQ